MRSIAILALALGGCSSTPTSSLLAQFRVHEESDHLTADASFAAEDGMEDPLDDEDRVVLHFRDRELELKKVGTFYQADFDLDTAISTDEKFTFQLRRGGGDDATSSITAPPSWQLAPIPDFVSRSSDFTISWAGASIDGDAWMLDTSLNSMPCAAGFGRIPPGVTSLLIPANSVVVTGNGGTCTAKLRLSRLWGMGIGGTTLAGGSIDFERVSTTPFASTP